MASLQLKRPIQESIPVANWQHDEHATAQKHQEADAKQVATAKSKKHLTHAFFSPESEPLPPPGKTKEKGKKEAIRQLRSKKLPTDAFISLESGPYKFVSLESEQLPHIPIKSMKAEHKIKDEKEKKKKKKKKKSKSKDDTSSSSSSESEDDVCSKKKGGKEKKRK